MTKIIAIANQKGGVGKTTTSTALAAGLHSRGYKVLAIDVDPQGNFSDTAGAECQESHTIYDVIKGEVPAEEAIQKLDCFDMIPANIMLAGFETELPPLGKEQRLKEYIDPIAGRYDFIVIDTPPSLGTFTINAFTLANQIIIPTHAGVYATTGMIQLNTTIKNVRKYCYNQKLSVIGILITRFNPRTNINKDMRDLTERIGRELQMPIFNTFIRSSVVVEEAQANKLDIFSYSPESIVGQDYTAFIEEYLKKQEG